ncbi:hypothetical protein X948_5431 [Burkholderia pseudomallei MSHR5608]|nr:hypothetical protein X948_5431 [Burkholderia pseudomallei MSHR5608]
MARVVKSLIVSGPTFSSKKPINETISGSLLPRDTISLHVRIIVSLISSGRELPERRLLPYPNPLSGGSLRSSKR